MTRRKTQQEFIEEAQAVHGIGEFDYSEVDYIDNSTEVWITCKHGHRFRQRPYSHLNGNGCKMCYFKRMRTGIYSVGLFDGEKNERYTNTYQLWRSMIKRCYNDKDQIRRPEYKGCSVYDKWLTFSKFKEWHNQNYIEGYQLDKDILVKGNRVYGPNTCCFVPKELNILISKLSQRRGKHKNGVQMTAYGRYASYIRRYSIRKCIGVFDTHEEAFAAYKTAKEAHIKEVATSYYDEGKITEKVYNTLMNYQIETTD